MDDDSRELIERLCTQAGMIMEDASPAAIIRSRDDAALLTRIGQIVRAGEDILAMARAAEAIARRQP